MKRDILYFGKPERAIQIGDVMVDPTEPKSLSRNGAFFKIASQFLERYLGYGLEGLLGFGFPNQRAMRLASILNLYAKVETMVELHWSSTPSRLRLLSQQHTLEIQHREAFSRAIDTLWNAMQSETKDHIIGVRDSRYILTRYFDRPEKKYRVHLLTQRWTGKPQALFVCNVDTERFELIDFVAPLKAIPLVIEQARQLAFTQGFAQLLCRITSHCAPLFQKTQPTANKIDISVPANIWTSAPQPSELENRWWLMSGDMDVV
jgi:hypothetical protein